MAPFEPLRNFLIHKSGTKRTVTAFSRQFKVAQIEPKSLALTDRNHWRKLNRVIHLMRKDSMTGKKSSILHMIDNPKGWDIDQMKEAFEVAVLTDII